MKKAIQITIDTLVKELDQARQLALENGNATAMISATMAKAKLLGLDKGETITINHAQAPVFNIQPVRPLTANEVSQYYKELMQ